MKCEILRPNYIVLKLFLRYILTDLWFELRIYKMPLPAALAARLAKRGLISGSEKHGNLILKMQLLAITICETFPHK